MEILDFLVQKNILPKKTAKQYAEEIKKSEMKAEELLLENKVVDEDTLFELKSEMLQMPLRRVDADEIPVKALKLISEDSAKYYKMMPLGMKDEKLEVGMVYPRDLRAQGALQFLSRQGNFSYQVSLITLSTFERLLKQYRNLRGEVKLALDELEQEVQDGPRKKVQRKENQLSRVVEDAPITKMVAVIVRNAVEGGASDIHIEPARDQMRVRFRFMGQLHPSLFLPMRVHSAIVARIKILSNLKIDETRKPQDGRFSMIVDDRNIDFRVATFPTSLGEKVAIRILDPNVGLRNFDDLGLRGSGLEHVKEAMEKPFGLMLVTGPTGSGKTTTLYTILRQLNKDNVNIVSLEDPVEYVIGGISQSQVKPEIGYDFAQGLRQILRQDPDIIMVGEVRDKETASLVIHAALTGHIVLSTLHTNNSLGIVPRLVDMGIDKYLIPVTLTVGMGQRLVRRLCQECKKEVMPSKAIKELLQKEMQQASGEFQKRIQEYSSTGFKVFEQQGCKKCGSSGFAGRVGIYEVLKMTDSLSNLILESPSEQEIGEEARNQGMVTMFQDGILKALEGITTVQEVLRVAEESGD